MIRLIAAIVLAGFLAIVTTAQQGTETTPAPDSSAGHSRNYHKKHHHVKSHNGKHHRSSHHAHTTH